MRKLLTLATLAMMICVFATSCGKDEDKDTWSQYEKYRKANIAFFDEQQTLTDADGKPFYTKLAPDWNRTAEILIHYFNDRSETAGNLVPMLTSTCAVKYRGQLYNGAVFDSTSNALNQTVNMTVGKAITGVQIALMDMHVGDSARVVIPYNLGYGGVTTYTGIPPYSTLVFDIKLTDIPYYEIRP